MAFLDSPTPLAFAHRGFAPDGGENSMAAFERAVALGYRYLETDVQVTSDGVALAFHDSTLDRVTDLRGAVARLPWSQIRHARIDGREPIPLLVDVLAAWPHTRINLDVKTAAAVGPTVEAIRRTGMQDRVCVASFSGARLTAIRRLLGPGVCTAVGPREALGLRILRRVPSPVAGDCVQVPARAGRLPFVDARYVRAAHRLGLQVHVWTVNETGEMIRLLELGVDGLITDRADVLRELLASRGQWDGA